MKFTYDPQSGEDSDIVEVFGHVFEAGESVDVTDERAIAKLKGNPSFRAAGEKDRPGTDAVRAESDKKLAKAIDGRSKQARTAREKATEAQADADAKQRAEEQARAIAEARTEAEANANA